MGHSKNYEGVPHTTRLTTAQIIPIVLQFGCMPPESEISGILASVAKTMVSLTKLPNHPSSSKRKELKIM